jgi:hypothetical protein
VSLELGGITKRIFVDADLEQAVPTSMFALHARRAVAPAPGSSSNKIFTMSLLII